MPDTVFQADTSVAGPEAPAAEPMLPSSRERLAPHRGLSTRGVLEGLAQLVAGLHLSDGALGASHDERVVERLCRDRLLPLAAQPPRYTWLLTQVCVTLMQDPADPRARAGARLLGG